MLIRTHAVSHTAKDAREGDLWGRADGADVGCGLDEAPPFEEVHRRYPFAPLVTWSVAVAGQLAERRHRRTKAPSAVTEHTPNG